MRIRRRSSGDGEGPGGNPLAERNHDSEGYVTQIRAALTVTLFLAVVAGVLFPALILGASRLLFPEQAGGSLVVDEDGQVVGSSLIGQQFTSARYFHPRPSAAGSDGYDASSSSGLNLGPTNPRLTNIIADRARAYREENGLADHAGLPADAVTTSASGLDPHISLANAVLQVPRVAAARNLAPGFVESIVREHTDDRFLGFFGEPRVNVLEVNLALDQVKP